MVQGWREWELINQYTNIIFVLKIHTSYDGTERQKEGRVWVKREERTVGGIRFDWRWREL